MWPTGLTRPVWILRDITDPNHPLAVAKFDNFWWAGGFINDAELYWVADHGLVRMPLSGSPQTLVSQCRGGLVAWSPDGTSAAQIRNGATSGELRLIVAGTDRVADSLPPPPVTGCEFRACAEKWSFGGLSYSPDGGYISYLSNISAAFHVWKADGTRVASHPPGYRNDYLANPSMAVWSGTTLYWRDVNGIETWRAGTEKPALPGVLWIHPSASPAGGQIVFHVRDDAGMPHIRLLDTVSGQVKELKAMRSDATFVNAHTIWYREEAPCDASNPCDPDLNTRATGKTFTYDLVSGAESPSDIAELFDVWPHAA